MKEEQKKDTKIQEREMGSLQNAALPEGEKDTRNQNGPGREDQHQVFGRLDSESDGREGEEPNGREGEEPNSREEEWPDDWEEGTLEQKRPGQSAGRRERLAQRESRKAQTKKDGYFERLRSRKRKAAEERVHMAQTLSAEEYRRYCRKENRKRVLSAVASLACVCAVVLAAVGVVRLVSGMGRGAQRRNEAPAMAEMATEPALEYPERDVTLGCTGCILLHSPFLSSYPDAEGNYDFSSIFQYIEPCYSEPDFMTCEFEGALGGEEQGYHGYPTFRSPDVIIENIRDSGVDLQMLATNHIYDAGSAGLHRTLEVYREKGIDSTGVRGTEEEKRYYIADIQGVCVGFLDYVYETSGQGKNLNGIPVGQQDAALINSFDYDNLEAFYQEAGEAISQMRSEGARFIVMNLHWGAEYQLQESQTQREMAERLCGLGVDALIGGHPHCEQPIDVFESGDGSHQMFCIFSVGNALSNQRAYLMDAMPTGHTEDGVMVTLSLHQDRAGNVAITDVDLLPTWVFRYQANGSKYFILPLDDVEGLEALTGIAGIQADAQASYDRTMEELGPGLEKAKEAFLG